MPRHAFGMSVVGLASELDGVDHSELLHFLSSSALHSSNPPMTLSSNVPNRGNVRFWYNIVLPRDSCVGTRRVSKVSQPTLVLVKLHLVRVPFLRLVSLFHNSSFLLVACTEDIELLLHCDVLFTKEIRRAEPS